MRSIDLLPAFDPYTAEFEADPYAVYRAARAGGGLARHPFGVAALGYDEVQSVLRDRRFVNPPGLALRMFGITEGPVWERVTSNLLDLDGEEHTRLRRLVAQSFTPRSADAMRTSMREMMSELLSGCGDELDVVELVETYPIAVICGLLDVPRCDWPFISRSVEDLFRVFRPTVVDEQDIILAAMDAMDDYIDGLIARRRREGLTGCDLVTSLIRAEVEGDKLSGDEVRMLVSTVLGAGTDTTRNQLAAAIDTFVDQPEQWALLREQPDLVMPAVDEVLRFNPIVQGIFRVATADTTLGDVDVPAGTVVAVMTASANRDPEVFAEPDRFDIRRDVATPQLSFGGGIHYCLGVHLAKAELAEALTQMSRRWASIERAGPAPAKPRNGVGGPVSLPIAVNRAVDAHGPALSAGVGTASRSGH